MVVAVEARKFHLPYLSINSPQVTCLLYEPISHSLALMHLDSTFSLYPSFSPFTLCSSSLPPPQTLISPPSSSACFFRLNPNPNPNPRNPDCPDDAHVFFVVAGPCNGGSRVVLRFFVLGKDGKFRKTQVGCNQNGVGLDGNLDVVVDVSHGMKVLLAGSVNYLAMYSASAGEIWIFGLKLGGDEKGFRLVKCAVIDCHLPVSSLCISFGYLMLGELHGVRVFPLRALVKGNVGNRKRRSRMAQGKVEILSGEQQKGNAKSECQNLKLLNGVVRPLGESFEVDKNLVNVNLSKSKVLINGHAYNVLDGVPFNVDSDGNQESVKPRSLKLRQDTGEVGMQFVFFNDSAVDGMEVKVPRRKMTKVNSIRALSHQKFLILDSNGELHVLHAMKPGCAMMRQLTGIIQGHHLAAFHHTSTDTPTVWLSDGRNSVHLLVIPDTDNWEKENDISISDRKMIPVSVTEAIFASEAVQDMVPLAANTVLLLGQDSVYAYAIS